MEPCRQRELRMLPARARPVPFCRHGFLPPPRTSPRLLVAWVPLRWLARYCLTDSHSRLWLGFAPKISSAIRNSLTVCPSRFFTSTVAMIVLLSTAFCFLVTYYLWGALALCTSTYPPWGPGTEPSTSSVLSSVST